jgi:dipeptide/tripeptide permease
VGTGGIKPCVSAFGADQFAGEYGRRLPKEQVEKEVSTFFSAFYASINVGSVISFILSPLFRNIGYWLAFGIPAVFLCIATFVFWRGNASYLKYPPQGSVLAPMLRALYQGFSRRALLSRPENAGKSWIDMASGQPGIGPSDIVHAKAFWRVLPFFSVMPAFWMLFDQQSNAWVIQADRMNLSGIQPEQLLLANPVFVLILIPVMEKYVYPYLASRNIAFGEFRRIGVGILLSVAAFLMAAYLQSQIPDDLSQVGPSVFWQIPQSVLPHTRTHTYTHTYSQYGWWETGDTTHPQSPVLPPVATCVSSHVPLPAAVFRYFLISFAEILISITGLEFAYSQAPPALKSTLSAVWLVTTGLGNLFAGLLWEGLGNTMSVTSLNILFAALMLVDGMAFVHISYNFKHLPRQVGNMDAGSEEELKDVSGVDSYDAPAITHELAHVNAIEDL